MKRNNKQYILLNCRNTQQASSKHVPMEHYNPLANLNVVKASRIYRWNKQPSDQIFATFGV